MVTCPTEPNVRFRYIFCSMRLPFCLDPTFYSLMVMSHQIPTLRAKIEEFERLPFHLIYHSSPILATDPTSITYHRNAEVLVPRQLPLDSLKWIACRSEAEYETLLHLLPTSVRVQWIPRIGVWPNYQLFHNRWSFVERVRSSGDILIFTLNKQTESPGPFAAVVELLETATGTRYRWSRTDYDISETGGETFALISAGSLLQEITSQLYP